MSTISFSSTGLFSHGRTFSNGPARAFESSARSSSAGVALRLTRRGKIVVLTMAVVAISLLAVMFGPSSTATDQAGAQQQTTMVQVLPGHTLWQIAAAANPDGDIRATVDDIIELNSLPNASALQMGSEIAVPVYDR